MTISLSSTNAANASAPRRAGLLAALAVGSALLSNFAGITMESAQVAGYPILPGLYFGAVIATGAYLWATRGKIALVVIVLGIVVAWVLAFQSAISVNLGLSEFLKGSALPGDRRALLVMALSGLSGGVVGSVLTAASVSIACKDFRTIGNWARTIMAGAAAGLLLVLFDDGKGWAPVSLPADLQLLPLFLIWQPVVAAAIGFGLGRR